MPTKPVDDVANTELEIRLERLLSNLNILNSVASFLKDPVLLRKLKEARFSVNNVIMLVKRKYGVNVKRNTPNPEDL
jgi:hypothetical protein